MQSSMQALEWLKSLAPDPAAQEKYDRAHLWLSSFSGRWADAKHWRERFKAEGKLSARPAVTGVGGAQGTGDNGEA